GGGVGGGAVHGSSWGRQSAMQGPCQPPECGCQGRSWPLGGAGGVCPDTCVGGGVSADTGASPPGAGAEPLGPRPAAAHASTPYGAFPIAAIRSFSRRSVNTTLRWTCLPSIPQTMNEAQ
ncbi:MAG: hypothetical protein ACK559_36610, partial [bacterium]